MMPIPYTNSILENLGDTVPETITEDVKEAHGKYENQLFAHGHSSSNKSRPLNNLSPVNPNLGFSFEISSTDSKPEIYNKLKEASMMPQSVESKSSFEDNRLLSDFTSKMRVEDTDHSDQLIVMMGNDEKDTKLGISDESNLINLTKLIEQHVKPFNDHFKSIKVRVKVKAEHDSKADQGTVVSFKKDGIPTHNLTVRKSRANPSQASKRVGSMEDGEHKLNESRQESTKSKSNKYQTEDVENERKSTTRKSKKNESDVELKDKIEREITMSKKNQSDWEYVLDDESTTSKSKKNQSDVEKIWDVSEESTTSKLKKRQIDDVENKYEESSKGKLKKHQIDDVENKYEEVSEESSTAKSKKDQIEDMENKSDEESRKSSISELKKRLIDEMEFINDKNEDFDITQIDREPKARASNSEITQIEQEPKAKATNSEITQIERQPKACVTNSERYTVYVVGEKRSNRRDFIDKFIPKNEKRIDKVPLQFSSTNNSYYPSNQYVINRHDYPEQNKIELNNTPQKRHYESQGRDGNIKNHASTNTSSENKDSTGINNVSSFQIKTIRSDRPQKKALSEKLLTNQMGNESNSNSEASTSKIPSSQNLGNIDTRSENKETKNFNDSTGIHNVSGTDNKMANESNSSEKNLEDAHSKSSEEKLKMGEANLIKSARDDSRDTRENKLDGGLKPENIDERLFSIESAEYEKYIQSIEDPSYQSISAEEKSVEQSNEDKPAYTKIEEEINGERMAYFVEANHRMDESPVYSNLITNEDKKDNTLAELEQDTHSKDKSKPEAIDRIDQERNQKGDPKESEYSINNKQIDYSTTNRGKKNNVFDRIHEEIHKQKIEQIDDIAMIKDIRDSSKQVTGQKDESVYLSNNDGAPRQSRPEWAWLFGNDKFDVKKSNPLEVVDDLKPDNLTEKKRYLGENIKDIKEKTNYQEVFEKNLNTKTDNLDETNAKKEPLTISEDLTSEPKDNRVNKETSDLKDPLKLSFLDQLTKKLKSHRQRKEKEAVEYYGDDPYKKKAISARYYLHEAKEANKIQKIGPSRPDAYPPINPRMPIPRPPFDVRDQEYHTVCYRPPPNLLRPRLLPRRRMQVSIHTRQAGGACSHVTKLPTPLLKLPQSVMRSSALAVELGLLAGLLTHYKRGCK